MHREPCSKVMRGILEALPQVLITAHHSMKSFNDLPFTAALRDRNP